MAKRIDNKFHIPDSVKAFSYEENLGLTQVYYRAKRVILYFHETLKSSFLRAIMQMIIHTFEWAYHVSAFLAKMLNIYVKRVNKNSLTYHLVRCVYLDYLCTKKSEQKRITIALSKSRLKRIFFYMF